MDHTENEDKHLLTQVIDMSQVKDTQVAITSPNTTGSIGTNDRVSGGGGCGSGSQELVSLSGESTKQLLSIVLNNTNYIPISNSSFLLFFNKIFNIDFYYYFYEPFYLFEGFIKLICQSCNSDCKCECTCKCVTECTGNTICLCLCDGAKGLKGKECCICICKKQQENSCKCICICICNKAGGCTGEHQCKEHLIKIDIGTLLSNTHKILCYLRWIRCCISILEKKCCYCSCCLNGRCGTSCCEPCQSIINYYKSIISRIHWIELLFKEVGTKIADLRTLKNMLSLIMIIAKPCEKCCSPDTQQNSSAIQSILLPFALILAITMIAFGAKSSDDSSKKDTCKEKIDSLIKNIDKSLHYYYLFGSRIKDIRPFVYYKMFYPRSKQIISSLEKSINPLSKQLNEINNYLVYVNMSTNNASLLQINKLLIGVISIIVIDESIFVLSRLYMYSKIKSEIDEIFQLFEHCPCYKFYNIIFKVGVKDIQLPEATHFNDNPHLKLHSKNKMINDENKFCLCLVVRYVLLNDLYVLIRYQEYLYMDMLSWISRSHKKYSYSIGLNFNISKLLMLIVITLDKITLWMKKKFIGYKDCYCANVNNPYYGYLVSITLFVSSIVENIWTKESETVRMAIQKISSLLSEYQSLHVYTNYGSREQVYKNIQNFLIFSHFGSLTQLGLKDLYMKLNIKSNTLINSSIKSYYRSVNTILTIAIPLPLFNIALSKLSSVSFLLMNQKDMPVGYIRHSNYITALIYTKSLRKQPCPNQCCTGINKEYKICPITKIKLSCLNVSLNRIEIVLSNVMRNILLFHLKKGIDRFLDFITNLCVGFGEVYAIMLKNTKLAHRDTHLNPNYSYKVVKDASTANWGYDTKYQHFISILSNQKISDHKYILDI